MDVNKIDLNKYLRISSIILIVLSLILALKVSYMYGYKDGSTDAKLYYKSYQDTNCKCYDIITSNYTYNLTQELDKYIKNKKNLSALSEQTDKSD